jgi:Protein of unknown function (DUF1688)
MSPKELLNAAAVRKAAHEMLRRLERGEGAWQVDLSKLDIAAQEIVSTTLERYPDLNIPYHSRWRHFEAGGVPRRQQLAQRMRSSGMTKPELARAEIDLAVVSVLMDAGSGPDWKFVDEGRTYTRSEGLGVASFRMFEQGAFSSQSHRPFQVDAVALMALSSAQLEKGFSVSASNPLVGVAGRTQLLNRLGTQLNLRPDMFQVGDQFRPGGLFDYLSRGKSTIAAGDILTALLEGLGGMWLTGNELEGQALGDCWPYGLKNGAITWVPFHKLSQWLSYSMLEAFEAAGIAVIDLDALTGLPEYRNGGLLMDTGVLQLKNQELRDREFLVSDPVIIEWRAATVALLDQLAPMVKAKLGFLPEVHLPLAKVLEGGSWAAGRKTAQRLRAGLPPLNIMSDGTVF